MEFSKGLGGFDAQAMQTQILRLLTTLKEPLGLDASLGANCHE